MRRETLLLVLFLGALVAGAGCKRGAEGPDLSQLGPSSAATTTVLPVGSQPCPGGGIGVYAGRDGNGNGVLEASEVQKGTPVCDPLNEDEKPAGHNSLVAVASEPSGTTHCPAGGLKVQSGVDANRNNALDAQEIALTEYLCNGTPGASSPAGITVAVAPAAPPAEKRKKAKKAEPAKKPKAAADRPSAKAAPQPAADAQAAPAPEAKEQSASPAAQEKKAKERTKAAASKEKSAPAAPPAAPKGWTTVKVASSQLASASYRIEGKSITVRFTNLSGESTVRFKYTVRWKVKQNGNWVDDSTMEGISFRLKPKETIDREVRTQTQDVRDVVVDLDVMETS